MTSLSTSSASRPSHRFRSRIASLPQGPILPFLSGPRSVLLLALWFGLTAGLLETALLFAKKYLFHAAVLGSLQMNRHAIWMISGSNLIIFCVCGILLSPLSLIKRSWLGKLIVLILATIMWLCISLTLVNGLTTAAYILFSCGVGSCLTRWAVKHGILFRHLVRKTTPVFMLLVLSLYGLDVFDEKLAPRAAPPPAGAPNVLWIVLDTIRAESLSLYGYHRPTSPHLEQWGRQGILFDQARSPAPWTLPAHASMFTGLWPHQLSTRLDVPLDDKEPTIAEYLHSKGYSTAGFVANTFFCNAWYGLGRGFTHYEDSAISLASILRSSGIGRRLMRYYGNAPNDRPHAYCSRLDAKNVNQGALDWLGSRDERPYFVFMNYFDAHDPYLLPPGETAPKVFRTKQETTSQREILRNWHENPQKNSPEAIELARDAYDEGVAYVDKQVDEFLAESRRRGDLDNTLIIVTSDHGESIGEHGEFGHGSSLRRQLTHVPLLIIPPSSSETTPRNIPDPVTLRDLPATVVDLLGVGEGSPFPGRSMSRFWKETASQRASEPDLILSEIEQVYSTPTKEDKLPRSLVAEGRTYIRQKDGREELYDLYTDLQEVHNLINAPGEQAVVQRFRLALARLEAP